jgi:hypothetical protein
LRLPISPPGQDAFVRLDSIYHRHQGRIRSGFSAGPIVDDNRREILSRLSNSAAAPSSCAASLRSSAPNSPRGIPCDRKRFGSRSLRHKLESHNRIDARRPRSGPPCLHDPLIRNQLYIPAFNSPAEQPECPASFGLNLCCVLAERAELLGAEQDLIDPRGRGVKIDFLVYGCARLLGLGIRRGDASQEQAHLASRYSCAHGWH